MSVKTVAVCDCCGKEIKDLNTAIAIMTSDGSYDHITRVCMENNIASAASRMTLDQRVEFFDHLYGRIKK